jgi:hypothetical protein
MPNPSDASFLRYYVVNLTKNHGPVATLVVRSARNAKGRNKAARFEGDGVACLQTVYKNPSLPLPVRLDAAAKAARFVRPMLSATNMRVIRSLQDLTDEELDALRARAKQQEAMRY